MPDVMAPQDLDIAGAVNYAKFIPDYANQELDRQRLQIASGTLDYQRQQEARLTAKQQADMAALAEQQRQAEELLADPSPTNIFNYGVRNPGVANELKATWDTKSAADKEREFKEATGVYTMALRDPAKAGAYLRTRSTAGDERDEEEEQLADWLESGDKAKIRQAYAQMGLHVMAATGDGEKYEKAFREYYVPDWQNVGDMYVNKGWGDVYLDPYGKVQSGPAGFYPFGTPEGIPILGGGTEQTFGATPTPTPTPSPGGGGGGAPGSGLRTGGWTPRQRYGGDNSDAAVDGKLQVIQQRTGFNPDQPLTGKDLGNVYDAIVASEGTNSIGARNNNGGNIKDGAWAKGQPGYAGSEGGFAKFKTPEAGRAAGMKLLGRKFMQGHKTVRDIIEGKVDTARVRRDARAAIAAGRDAAAVKAAAAQMGVTI